MVADAVFVWISATAALASGMPSGTEAAEGELRSHRLANGLGVHVVEKRSCPIATVQVWYRTGALNEHPGIRGLSHLFEHMMFRGSERFGPEEHSNAIARLGGSSNAFTSEDVTVYHQIVPASGVDLILEMEADRMARLKLDEGILKTEIDVVAEEYRLTVENDPMGRVMYEFASLYFGDHPYGYAVIGEMNDLDTVSVATCLAYYRDRYAPNNAALIVAGDVDADSVFRAARRRFGSIPPAARITPDPPPPPPPPRELRGKTDLPIPISGVVYRLPPVGHPDHTALEIFASILQKRVDWRLTRMSSLCVYVEGEWMPNRQCTIGLVIGAHLPSVSAEKVIRAIDREIEGYLDGAELTREELERSRNPLLLNEAMKRHRVESVGQGIGEALFIAGDLGCYTGRTDGIASLTAESVREAARRHFLPENRTEVRIEPKETPLWIKVAGWFKTTLHI
jgi:zinc protease